MQIGPYVRRGSLVNALRVIFASRRLVCLVWGMSSPLFDLGTVLNQSGHSCQKEQRAKPTFVIPVNIKFVEILILHSILSTFSWVTVGGSSGASSHFSL
jgi:hypothetical protein